MIYSNKPAEFSFYAKLTSGVIKATTTPTGDTELTLFAYSGNGPITAIRVKCGDSESWTTATEPHHQSKYTHVTAAATCPGSPKTVTVSAKDPNGWQPDGPANCNWLGLTMHQRLKHGLLQHDSSLTSPTLAYLSRSYLHATAPTLQIHQSPVIGYQTKSSLVKTPTPVLEPHHHASPIPIDSLSTKK